MRPVLEAINLEKIYGRQTVLAGLSFIVPEGAHIALLGRNGSGKTTLLRLLAQDEETDKGKVQCMPWTRLGVLRQHEAFFENKTTMEYLSEDSGKPEWTCAKLAARFGLHPKDLALTPATLSGGYQMRVKLIRVLLEDPTLLLLDEPVNYLDLPTLLLLEVFLRDYPGAFIMTSHDREILQNVCTTTWELSKGKLVTFPGDVETYLDWKEEQAEYVRRTNKRLRREMADAQAFADRFRAKASLATRAQSKLKHITKLRARLRDLDDNFSTIAFRIPCSPVVPGTALRCENLSIGYEKKVIADHIFLEVPRGAKVAIVGENGRGKSTLLRTLAGSLPAIDGSMKWWHRADVGYFSQQDGETLAENQTVLEALTKAAPANVSAERILAAAGAFLFHGDDLEKSCSVLSGGERARVRLARLILHEHTVLLLDEPTNHLDAETVEILAKALNEYAGTVFVVSHARTFMNAFAERIYEVRNGTVRHYLGTYEEYVSDLTTRIEELASVPECVQQTRTDTNRKEQMMRDREHRRAQQRLEEEIKRLEKEKSSILAYFFENPTDYAPEKSRRLSEIEALLEQTEKKWFAIESSGQTD
ncbi:MAG: putative ABC transporter ATP-binding protein ybiT [Candidatus Uhrbacteria bacterium GW2011_GWF2_41_16]|uniref:Putative ABC transporter ATP-binding protein ybiT n=2 Tax=Candidatus Uhriibacteriota TaxID=1752732 RepID=A0A0G0V9K6_9BACT|nr:MAG: putative ABC transporter ATP-binding protein ybiT [Candidatus Uhrbacteria bacterium GW2011_GWC2_41_11]KKR97703.1 MAG: putative ABC transporter ATP-binding protein ybiT [Candidatus Uhrbacteria bacterium GW2011_GWF2_41_16]HBO99723.1 ABC transporter ATP-binding protein [Candidatus Uhrbacteria bacterium]